MDRRMRARIARGGNYHVLEKYFSNQTHDYRRLYDNVVIVRCYH